MSEQKEKSFKTKAKEFAYKAADKVGHAVRKAGPYILTVAGGLFAGKLWNDHHNKNNSTKA